MNSKQTPMEQGWAFALHLSDARVSSQVGSAYVDKVNDAIEQTAKSLMQLKNNQSDPVMGGFVAERWHAGSFNVKAVAAGSKNIAVAGEAGTNNALGRNNYGSVDVRVQTENGTVINDYGSKYMVNAKETAKAQAMPSKETGTAKYSGQRRLVPSDQLEDVKEIASRRASNEKTPEPWEQGYQETADSSTDKITDGKVSSKGLSKGESEEMAQEIKKDELDLEKHGLTADDAIEPEFIVKQAAKAGLTAAAISALIKTAPDIYKAIDYLIKIGSVDRSLFKRMGLDAITGASEGFLRGFVACNIQILCDSGKLGKGLIGVDSIYVGTIVALTIQIIKDSVKVAQGKLTMREMGAALIDSVIISTGYIVGAKIGGAIGAAIGFELPVVGFLLGSLIGCAFGAIYDVSKKKFISFCVDSGFTCFGLVDQDYTLPEDFLNEIGIDIAQIDRTEVNRSELNKADIKETNIDRTSFETIEIKVLRRGVLGVNKVGYVY